ncbi:hypothetical protein CAEBREN_24454 [Caenorhabditis brenneri]|uniref:Uncharacterized protein n=1 Tax=Caenorhabditis brenneri TaxID=135651 RepID=G0P3Y6_CAEBE|nr:hypothetical protein CAEBREN_24454 [Caenorhabditis brenneri]
MTNLPEKHPNLTDILQPQLKKENPMGQEQNLNLVSNANNSQFNLFPSTPPVSPYSSFNHRNQIMNPQFHMQNPIDPIRTVLSFQAQENIASRRDAAERQAQVSQVLVDVTKMLLKEQENNRNFQKEIIEMFATKLSEHSEKLTAAAPATAQALVPVATSPVRDPTAGTSGPSYSPYSRKRKYPSVIANKKVIGKGKGYDETTQSFTSFECNFCADELPNRKALRKHV